MAPRIKQGHRVVIQRGPDRGAVGTVIGQQGVAFIVRLDPTPTRRGRVLQLQPASLRKASEVVGGEGT